MEAPPRFAEAFQALAWLRHQQIFLVARRRLTCRRDTSLDFCDRGLRTPQAATCSVLADLQSTDKTASLHQVWQRRRCRWQLVRQRRLAAAWPRRNKPTVSHTPSKKEGTHVAQSPSFLSISSSISSQAAACLAKTNTPHQTPILPLSLSEQLPWQQQC